ncbi:neuroblast differentiation-associated protein AHNAK-like [Palaemon carinicauda]|uniref:neuroblast differentiation-associated protein AHNAK-like n=1 Tax=Palaemon carinicauda TaxID=392227 RepID=UPI0035B69E4D
MSSRLMLGHRTTYAMPWWVGGLLLTILAVGVGGQDEASSDTRCSCDGAIAASVIITFILTLAACGIAYFVNRFYCRRGQRPSDGKKNDVDERAAYDNPHFQPDESSFDIPDSVAVSTSSGVGGPSPANVQTLSGSGQEKGMSTLEKLVQAVRSGGTKSPRRAFDDSHLTEPWVVAVPLRGHDFTGLGFNISGNMRDGVFVKDVQHRGPASESGKINPGDRLLGLAVSTEHMVHEDALTLLSYASPYPVILLLEKYASGADKRLPSTTGGRPIHPFYRSQSIDDLTKIGKADMSRVRKAHLSGARQMKSELSRHDLDISRELGVLKGKDDRAKSKAGNKKIDLKLAKREAPERHSERAIDVPGVELSKPSPSFQVAMPSVDKPDPKMKFGIKVLPDLTKRTPKSDLDLEAGGFEAESSTLSVSGPPEAEINVESEVGKIPKKDMTEGKTSEDKIPSGAKFGIKLPHFSLRTGDASDVTDRDTVVCQEHSIDERNVSLSTDISGIALTTLGLSRGQGDQSKDSHEPKTDDEKQKAKGAFGFGFQGFGKDDDAHTTASDEEKAKTHGSIGVNIVPPEISSPLGDVKLNLSQRDGGENGSDTESREGEGVALNYNSPDLTLPFLNEGLEFEGNEINKEIGIGNLSGDIKLPQGNLTATQGGGVSAELGMPKKGASLQFPSIDVSAKKVRDANDSDKEENSDGKSGMGIKTGKFALPSMSLKFQSDKDKQSRKEKKHREDNEETQLESESYKDNEKDSGALGLDLQGPKISTSGIDLSTEVTLPSVESSSEDGKESKKKEKSKKEFGFGFKTPDFKLPSMSLKGKWGDDSGDEDEHTEKEKGKGKKSFNIGLKGPDFDLPTASGKVDVDLGDENLEKVETKFSPDVSESYEFQTKDKKESKDNEDERSRGGFGLGLKGPNITMPNINLRRKDSEKEDAEDDGHDESQETKDVPKKGFGFNFKAPDITLPKLSFKKGDDEDDDQDEDYETGKHGKDFKIAGANVVLSKEDKEKSSKEKEADDSLGDDGEERAKKSREGFGISFGTPSINMPSFNLKSKKKGNDVENMDFEDNNERSDSKESLSFGLRETSITLPSVTLDDQEENSDREGLDEENSKGQEKHKKSSSFGLKKLDINLPSIKLKGRKEGNVKEETESDEDNGRDKTRKGFNINLKGQMNDAEEMVSKEFGYDARGLEVTMPAVHLKDKSEGIDRDESGEYREKSEASLGFGHTGLNVNLPFKGHEWKSDGSKGDSDNEDLKEAGDEDQNKKKSKEGLTFGLKGPDISFPKFSLKGKKENIKETEENDTGKDFSGNEFSLGDAHVQLPSVEIKGKRNNQDDKSDDESEAKGNSKKGFKLDFKAPKLGFHSNSSKNKKQSDHGEVDEEKQEGEDLSRGEYSLHLRGPDVKLPHINTEDQADVEGYRLEDKDNENKDKSWKGLNFGFKKPNINIPGMSLNAQMEADDRGLDDDKCSDKENSGKVSLSSLKLKGQKSSNQEESSNEEDHEDAVKSRKGFGFNLKGMDVSLPSINLRGRKDGKDDGGMIDEIDNSNKVSSKGHSFDLQGPDVRLPHISIKSKRTGGDEEELKELSDEDKRLKGKMKLESDLSLSKDTEISDEEDGETKKSKTGRNFGFKLPTFSLRGQGKEDHERDLDSDNEENVAKKDPKQGSQFVIMEKESYKVNLNMDNLEKEQFERDDEQALKSKREFGLSLKGPRNILPTLGFQRQGDGSQDSDDDSKTTGKSSSTAFKEPDISHSHVSIDNQGSDIDEKKKGKSSKKGFAFGFKAPDITLPTFKSSEGDRDREEISDEEGNSKNEKEERTIAMSVRYPEITVPKLEGQTVAKLPQIRDKEDERNDKEEKRGKNFEFRTPGLDLASLKIEGERTDDGERYVDKTQNRSKEGEQDSKRSFDIGVKLPDFSLPTFSLHSKGDKVEISENSNDESEKKIRDKEDNKRKSKMAIEYESHSKKGKEGNDSDDDDEYREKSKNRKIFGVDINPPDFSLPSVQLRTKDSHPDQGFSEDEDEMPNKKGEKKSKKRFTFGLKGPDFNLTSKNSKDNVEPHKTDEYSGNKTKEMKSEKVLNLEFKGPDFGVLNRNSSGHKEDTALVDENTKKEADMEFKRKYNNESSSIDISLPKAQFSDKGKLGISVKASGDLDHDITKDESSTADFTYTTKGLGALNTGGPSIGYHDEHSKDHDLNFRGANIKLPAIDKKNEGEFADEYNNTKSKITERVTKGFDVQMPSISIGRFERNEKDADKEKGKVISMEGDNVAISKFGFKGSKGKQGTQESMHYEFNLKREHSNETEPVSPVMLSSSTMLNTSEKHHQPGSKSKHSVSSIMLPNVNVSLQKSDVNLILQKNAGIESNVAAGHGMELDVAEEDHGYNVRSDLPEADLDFHMNNPNLSGIGTEFEDKKLKSPRKQSEADDDDSRFSPGFGVAFGFKGFKKHIDIENIEKDPLNDDASKSTELVSKEIKIPGMLTSESMVSIKRQEIPEVSLEPPKAQKSISVKEINAPMLESGVSYQGPDVHTKKTKSISHEGLRSKGKQEGDFERPAGKARYEEDDEKSKNKNRFGLGFGFRGFGRSSDSEDDGKEPTSLTPDPDRPDAKEDKKKSRSRMSFGFKGFSKSSDTEEENSEKVSGAPMDKDGEDEKPRIKSKGGLHFSFKGRNSRSSDSEDNNDQEKVGTDPQPESGHIKQKLKPNLSFGFKGKSSSYDMDAAEGKSELKSDSEGIEGEEKASLDTRGEDASRIKAQKGRSFAFKSRSGKNTSDSEGGEVEERVELDTNGGDEKVKEQKSKGIRLGFKGFKNLKGKIQTEISRIRHDSHSSDDEATREGTVNEHPDAPEGKRKKNSKKKKEKEKKIKKEEAEIIDISEENSHVLNIAAAAAKDNRRKRTEKPHTSSSSSSSSSSEEENESSTEVKKRKRNRGRSRQVTTGITEVNVKDYPEEGEVSEKIQVVKREVNIILPRLEYSGEPNKMDDAEIASKRRAPEPPREAVRKPEKKDNVIVKEVKMKSSQPPKNLIEVNEVVQRTVVERHIPMLSLHDINSTASDSEGERVVIRSELEPITSSTPKHPPIDSEELKRKAASLGDLSRLQTEPEVVNVILERAMSLDFMRAEATTPVEKIPRLNHPLRLQLPDSSATSIDEEEETSIMALRVDGGTGLRRAGQWGTLEEALQLRKFSSSSLVETVSPKFFEPEGESVSHIEISGSTPINESSSQWVTASETSRRSITLHRSDDESEDPPALPSTPAPVGGTTITLLDGDATILGGGVEVTPLRRREDVDVVVVQSGRPTSKEKQVSSFSVQLCQVSPKQEVTHISKMITSSSSSSSRSSLSSDSEAEANMQLHETKRGEGVTVTVAPRISSVDVSGTSYSSLPPPVPPKPRSSRAQSPPELVVAHHEPAMVTVRENGAVVVSTDTLTHTENVTITPKHMEHVTIESVSMKPTISERVVVDSSENGNSLSSHLCQMEVASIPQKSFTQITVDGGGYTVSEGALSRTLIISTPSGPTVPSGPDSPPPTLQPPH